ARTGRGPAGGPSSSPSRPSSARSCSSRSYWLRPARSASAWRSPPWVDSLVTGVIVSVVVGKVDTTVRNRGFDMRGHVALDRSHCGVDGRAALEPGVRGMEGFTDIDVQLLAETGDVGSFVPPTAGPEDRYRDDGGTGPHRQPGHAGLRVRD